MKKGLLIILTTLFIFAVFAAEKLRVIKSDTSFTEFVVAAIDSIKFSSDNQYMHVYKSDKSIVNYLVAEVDSMYFNGTPDTVKITFSGSSATVVNPLEGAGVSVTTSGSDVIINSTLTDNEVNYLLTGTSTDGSVKLYSSFKSIIILNGLNLTNADGPAINNQSTKRTTVVLASGSTNALVDGSSYASSTEDQKGAFFSEGQLIFSGTGALTVKGNYSHGICSDDYIEIEGGIVTVSGAVKDGIHAKDHLNLESGSVTVTASGDAMECEAGKIKIEGGTLTATVATADAKGLKCDSTLNITGGTINITVSGNQAKGIKSGGIMNLSGGTIVINTSGAAATSTSGSGYAVSYCTAIKCDTTINLSGSDITITATGVGGKGISSDENINISGGIISVTNSGNGAVYTNSLGVADAYTGSGIEVDGNLNVSNGNITVTSSGTGAKGISADGAAVFGSSTTTPVVKVTNTGTKLLVSGTATYTTALYAEPKSIKSDGNLIFNSGTYTLSGTQQGNEIIDTDAALTINGGTFTVTLAGAQSKGLKSTGVMTLAGGTIGITASGAVTLQNVAAATYDPSYCTAIKGTGIINITGGDVTITHTGAGSKGISGDAAINISGGTTKITTSGAGATYKNSSGTTDSYSAACISTDTNLSITGGSVICSSSGSGGKGLKATGSATIGSATDSPTVTLTTTGATFTVSGSDLCHPKTLVCDGAIIINSGLNTITSADDGIKSEVSITINGGTNTISKATEGIESKVITINGGSTYVTASDDGINTTASTQAGGTESNDGSYFYMKGGLLTTVATSGDALDSNGSISMTGGTLVSFGPSNSTNEDIDANGSITIDGGLLFGGCMKSNMFESIASSAQYGANLKGSAAIATASGYMQIKDAAGTVIGTFKTPQAYYYFHLSSSAMKASTTYSIYTGGTYTGGTTTGGYCTGGTYSGGTLKKSFTTSSSKISTLTL